MGFKNSFTILAAKFALLAVWQLFLRLAEHPNELAPGTHAGPTYECGLDRRPESHRELSGRYRCGVASCTSSALDLVSEAAGVDQGHTGTRGEIGSPRQSLAESALEKLQVAVSRIQSAEAARGSAQETLCKLSARLQEAEQELARTQSRIAATERRLADAERALQAAETRAVNAEKAVSQIEDAIRTQLVGLQKNLTGRSIRAA